MMHSGITSPCVNMSALTEGQLADISKCEVNVATDLMNMAFICNREPSHTATFVILYILVSAIAIMSNSSVVLASIVERWKEIDQFTFVFAVSLSFNHFLVAFLVYPMGIYTMFRADGWGLGHLWCQFTSYCTSYFEVLYMMHVVMIIFDMLLYRFTKLKEVVKVFLVKKVAMSLWVTAAIPHFLLIMNNEWFLPDGGTLGIKEKYRRCLDPASTHSIYNTQEKVIINCVTAYTFTTMKELWVYVICFILLPVTFAALYYITLLYLRKRYMLKGHKKEEVSEEDALENARTFIQRYKASLCMVVVFLVTQLPKWIISMIFSLNEDDQDKTYGLDVVARLDFVSWWTCLGSILIPVCYMMTCPTYFHAVTATRPLLWLRKHGEVIHGRTYSRRLRLPEGKRSSDSPNGSPRVRLDTNSKIIMNSITEECNGTQDIATGTGPYDSVGRNSVIANQVVAGAMSEHDHIRASRGDPASPDGVRVIVTEPPDSDTAPPDRPGTLPLPPTKKGLGQPISTSTPKKDEHSPRAGAGEIRPHPTPQSSIPQQDSVELDDSRFFPHRPLKYSELIELPVREKQKAPRKLPAPKPTSRTISPVPSDNFSSSSKL